MKRKIYVVICGGLGVLLAMPTGLSRITLELEADNAWSPGIFTASWQDAGNEEGEE